MATPLQSIDPALLALQTAKKAMPASPNTQAVAKPSLNVQRQQPQAISTNITPPVAKIGGISSPFGATNINSSPVLWWATPQEIGTRATELQSLPKAMPQTGTSDNQKYVDLQIDIKKWMPFDKMKELYSDIPESAQSDLYNDLKKGMPIEKIPELYPELQWWPTTTQNIAWWAVATIYNSWLAEPWKRVAKFLWENITKPLVWLLPEWWLKTKLLSNIEWNIKWMQDPVATLTPKADTESTAFKTTKLIGDIAQTAMLPSVWWAVKWQWFIKWALNLAKQWAVEATKFAWVSDKRLPTKEELALWIGWNLLIWWLMNIGKILPKKPPQDVKEIVWKVIQWKEKDIKPAIDTFSQIDTKWISTYKDLWSKVKEWNNKLMQSVDEILIKDNRNITPEMFTKTVKAWDQVISKDYMSDVIDNLTELYTKWWDIDKQAKILNVKELYNKWLLKIKDGNDLLRVYSSEFGDKAFSKASWDPLTSVSAQQYENIRKWAKELLRSQFTDDWLKLLDESYSKWVKTLELIDKMAEKVNALKQKVKPMNIIENVANKTSKLINAGLGWWPKAFIAWLIPSNVGNKIMNSLDMEAALAKSLQKIAELSQKVDDWTATKVDLELIKQYVSTFSSAGASSMGK